VPQSELIAPDLPSAQQTVFAHSICLNGLESCWVWGWEEAGHTGGRYDGLNGERKGINEEGIFVVL
jgi:hypothetical protein